MILALDRKRNGKEKVVNMNDIRPNRDVMMSLFGKGFVEIPDDRRIDVNPPDDLPDKNSPYN